MDICSNIREIKGIGDKTADYFRKLGILTVSDLLKYYPRGYETFDAPVLIREAKFRDFAAIRGVIMSIPTVKFVKKLQIVSTIIRDEEGTSLNLTWFNMAYLKNTLKPGMHYVFRGRLKGSGTLKKMEQPEIYRTDDYGRLMRTLQPVYTLTKGLTVKTIQKAVKTVMEDGVELPESLDQALRADYGLMDLNEAVKRIHFPESKEALIPARTRLVFEEFYTFIVNVRRMKESVEASPNEFLISPREECEDFIRALPYALTGAQKRVLSEIGADMNGPTVMNRLIQGDVGSGKTIVAFIAMYEAALAGYQSVLMAPTEVLASQHYANFLKMNETYALGLSICLLTGSMTAKEKREAYETITAHKADLVIGTHALIQEKVHYGDLALVITDEQHRFGVNQRKILSEKGRMPHVIVMSATPIPRTLALILYGDLDISVMNELPSDRLPIKNAVVDIDYRKKAYSFIEKQVRSGHQAYVICPMVEASESMEAENVEDYAKILSKELASDIRVEFLHGRMKNDEKEAIMRAFSENKIQVLVSTTVIEVGIDVPNATVMMVENAERFGLAQLHQLRGRVGRGAAQSYCIFVDTTNSEESRKRLSVLAKSNDGFFIANEDLKMRGPGDFFGIRQSGDLDFKLGDIYTDAEILKQAEEAASKTLQNDAVPKEQAIL